ncbi:MAG: hypothetical protein IH863_08615 [Chloroflexi bacterium]|nr:hypothetical protein [Chloroflexota bacterium]
MSTTFARLSVLILAALAVAFLAACGDDDDTADEPTPAASPIDGGPTSPARASVDFEGACSLVSVSEIALVLAVDPDDLVIDDQDTTCTISGESTYTIVLEERVSAEVAAAEVAAAGVGADPLSIGDGAYLVGDSVISSRDVYVITFTLDPPDDETLVGLARRAAVRVPTPTATPE